MVQTPDKQNGKQNKTFPYHQGSRSSVNPRFWQIPDKYKILSYNIVKILFYLKIYISYSFAVDAREDIVEIQTWTWVEGEKFQADLLKNIFCQ